MSAAIVRFLAVLSALAVGGFWVLLLQLFRYQQAQNVWAGTVSNVGLYISLACLIAPALLLYAARTTTMKKVGSKVIHETFTDGFSCIGAAVTAMVAAAGAGTLVVGMLIDWFGNCAPPVAHTCSCYTTWCRDISAVAAPLLSNVANAWFIAVFCVAAGLLIVNAMAGILVIVAYINNDDTPKTATA
jgi:hypothetical protein